MNNRPGQKVFVLNKDHVWLPATILEWRDDTKKYRVRIDLPDSFVSTTGVHASKNEDYLMDGREEWVSMDDYNSTNNELPLQNISAAATVGDIAQLPNLHEAAMLYHVRERHLLHQKPYTRVGEVIVAVNPCQWIPTLYNVKTQVLYSNKIVWQRDLRLTSEDDYNLSGEEKKDCSSSPSSMLIATTNTVNEGHDNFEPHIYETSAFAYRSLLEDRIDQTILVSGDAGAGKTETVKLIIQHLSTLEYSGPSVGRSASTIQDLEEMFSSSSHGVVGDVVKSSPVFEAFGNAKTPGNHNSSRFGKVTHLHYCVEENLARLCGTTSETYLLETTRVVSHKVSERSFNIFYQLLAAPAKVKQELLGDEWSEACVKDFRYLNQDCANTVSDGTTLPSKSDREAFDETLLALDHFYWRGVSLKALMRALGVVLRLGNLIFEDTDDNRSMITSTEALLSLSRSIGVSADELEESMTRRVIQAPKDRLEVSFSAEQAKDVCNALAKNIYSGIFKKVTRMLNRQTGPKIGRRKDYRSIVLVDIIGFENSSNNRFEQLCINWANESLQQKYIRDNVARYFVEYQDEGIPFFDWSELDNTDVLELIEGPSGMISALSEVHRMPNGSNEAFVAKLKLDNESRNPRLVSNDLHLQNEFEILHFAGPVVYDASKFLERNFSKLPDGLVRAVASSTNSLIGAEFQSILKTQSDTSAGKIAKRKTLNMTAMERFRDQLGALRSALDSSYTRYIRCIKPNKYLVPNMVDHVTMIEQLKHAGVISVTELSRRTFPNKMPFSVVVNRFECLLIGSKHDIKDMHPHDKAQVILWNVLAPLMTEQPCHGNSTIPFACGKTNIYFQVGAYEMLESLRARLFDKQASKLQIWMKKVVAEKRHCLLCTSAVSLQSWHRSRSQRIAYSQKRFAAISIQSWTRCAFARSESKQLRKAAMVLTTRIRYLLDMRLIRKWNRACTLLPFWARCCIERKRFQRKKQASVFIQSLIRCILEKNRYCIQREAAGVITKWGRRCVHLIRLEKIKAAIILEAWGRAFLEFKHFSNKKQAGSLLVRWWRLCFERKKRQREKLSSIIILQAWMRSAVESRRYQRGKLAATVLTTWARSQIAMLHYDRKRKAATVLEAWARSNRASCQYHMKRKAAIKLESWARLCAEYNHYRRIKKAVLSLQTWFRTLMGRSSTRKRFEPQNNNTNPIFSGSTMEIWRADNFLQDAKHYKEEAERLREEIHLVTTETELHKQEQLADFDQRLAEYEEEVLDLRTVLIQNQQEKTALEENLEAEQQAHATEVMSLKAELRNVQESHSVYLKNVLASLAEANETRKIETARIRNDLESVKRDKDGMIQKLQQEISLLKKAQTTSFPF